MHKVTPLEPKTASAARLAKTLTTVANDYGRLVAAGRANKPGAWARAFNAVKSDETILQGEVGKL